MSLSLCALALGCGSAPGHPGLERPPGGIGAPCRKDADCISGASCNDYSCDFVNPCSAHIEVAEGPSRRTYRYRADGQALGWEEARDGAVFAFERWGWSDDGRRAHVETFLGGSATPDVVTDLTYASSRETATSHETFHGVVELMTYALSDDWSCRATAIVVRDAAGELVYTTRATCADDGAPTRIEWVRPDGSVGIVKDSVYARGRLVERVSHYHVPGKSYATRHRYRRDERGAVVSVTVDQGDDGSIERTEVYDLGCWVVEGGRVHYRP